MTPKADTICDIGCELDRLFTTLEIISERLHEDEIPKHPEFSKRHLYQTWHLVDVAANFLETVRDRLEVVNQRVGPGA